MTELFCGAALMNAAMAVTSAVSTIVAGDRLGAPWAAVSPWRVRTSPL